MVTSVFEKEQEYGIRYGEDAINADMVYINSDNFARKFNNITDNEIVNKTLLECSRKAIEHRNGTLYEDMYLIDGRTGKILAKQLDTKSEQGISYSDEMNNAIAKANFENIPIVAFHSHPEGYPPSVDDFNSAYVHNYSLGVVVGHNGQIYSYEKPNQKIENTNKIQNDISFAYQSGFDVDRAYSEIFAFENIKYKIIKE